MWQRSKFIMSFSGTFKPLKMLAFLLFVTSATYTEVCVWRNPERTMARIFPEASDYKTIVKIISKEEREAIEKTIREELTPGEKTDWIYYEITDKEGISLGYIIADAEKGEYGVIEMVMGISPDGNVKGVYIQKSRERDKKFKSKEFLDQFIGAILEDFIQIETDKEIEAEPGPEGVVLFGVTKMLTFYSELSK